MRRQDSCSSGSDMRLASAVSASAHHENPNETTIGCVSSIICLLSKYHCTSFRKRKFLTFGKKQNQDKNKGRIVNGSSSPVRTSTTIQAASAAASSPAQLTEFNTFGDKSECWSGNDLKKSRLSCNIRVPRSPTLPADMRRISTPALAIARLMGLEEASLKEMQDQYYSRTNGQKRQQLLGALEKCDQDLKVIKKMINAVAVAPKRSMIEDTAAVTDNGSRTRSRGGGIYMRRSYSPGYVIEEEYPLSNHHHHHSRKQSSFNINFGRAQERRTLHGNEDYMITKFRTKSSSVVETTVIQVCRDIAWGEKREMGRIGLALQDQIYKNLIEELVAEMKTSCSTYTSRSSRVCSLSFNACKRRVSF